MRDIAPQHEDQWFAIYGEVAMTGKPRRFEQRIILVDGPICDEWGSVTARLESRGRSIHAMDALIAATALVHGLTLVTRNAQDFSTAVQSVLNPWT